MVYDYSDLIGRTITSVRNLSDEDLSDLGWDFGIEVMLDDGSSLVVAEDDEANYPGSLLHYKEDGTIISMYS